MIKHFTNKTKVIPTVLNSKENGLFKQFCTTWNCYIYIDLWACQITYMQIKWFTNEWNDIEKNYQILVECHVSWNVNEFGAFKIHIHNVVPKSCVSS